MKERRDRREYYKQYYAEHRDEKRIYKATHLTERNARNATRREEINALKRAWNAAHPESTKLYAKKYYSAHGEEVRDKSNSLRRALRLEVLSHYGGRCDCCGETGIEFLCIDHINGGGTQHRKLVGWGDQFYKWIKKNNFPAGFRVLCHNCNSALGHYGYCPHEKEK